MNRMQQVGGISQNLAEQQMGTTGKGRKRDTRPALHTNFLPPRCGAGRANSRKHSGRTSRLAGRFLALLRAGGGSRPVPSVMRAEDLGFLGRSDAMDELRATVRRVAESPYAVLVTGESDR